MSTLKEFYRNLALDPDLFADFVRDPAVCMANKKLDTQVADAVLHGAAQTVWLSIGASSASSALELGNTPGATENHCLTVVGTGIRTVGQLTIESMASIRCAGAVHYIVMDPISEDIIRSLNPTNSSSMSDLYKPDKRRVEIYEAMIDRVMSSVRAGMNTCAVFYGHPGIFSYAAHEAIRRVREEGYVAKMLPGISAEDCLFADLGVDPAKHGCQSFEATDFILNRRLVDPSSVLILWQVGVLADCERHLPSAKSISLFQVLKNRLAEIYPGNHTAVVYEAPLLPCLHYWARAIPIDELQCSDVSARQLLYIPPGKTSTRDETVASILRTP